MLNAKCVVKSRDLVIPGQVPFAPNRYTAVCVDEDATAYYFDMFAYTVWSVSLVGTVRLIAGCGIRGLMDGPILEAQFEDCSSICVTRDGTVCVFERLQGTVRLIKDGFVTTICYHDNPTKELVFLHAELICTHLDGVSILVLDDWVIKKVTLDGIVTGVARMHASWPEVMYTRDGSICVQDFGFDCTQTVCNNASKFNENRPHDASALVTWASLDRAIPKGDTWRDVMKWVKTDDTKTILAETHGYAYFSEENFTRICRIGPLTLWTPPTHRTAPRVIRLAIRTVMLMRIIRKPCAWSRFPVDVAYDLFRLL